MAKNLRLTDTVTISSSGSTSGSLQMTGGRVPLAVIVPSAFTGTALTFQASSDDASYYALYDESTQYSVNVGTSRYVALKRQAMDGVKYIKIVSSGTETASRSITVISGE